MELITISGMGKVGKTTLANLIAAEAFNLGFKPVLLPFAQPLKEEAERRGFNKDGNPKEYREFCQTHGALMREADPDYWIKAFEESLITLYQEEVKDLSNNDPYWERIVIADDCRYDNELIVGKKYKGTSIFLSRGKRKLPDEEGIWRQHHSESMATRVENNEDEEIISQFDYVLLNDDTEEALLFKAGIIAPVLCGIQACPKPGTNSQDLQEVMRELVDLFLEELEEEDNDKD